MAGVSIRAVRAIFVVPVRRYASIVKGHIVEDTASSIRPETRIASSADLISGAGYFLISAKGL